MRSSFAIGCAVVAACAGSAFAQVPGPNQAGAVTLNFIELEPEGGISLTGTDFGGGAIVAPSVTGETYRVGVPYLGGGNPTPNFIINHIGASQTLLANGGYLLVNIMEVPGPGDPDGTGALLSDQIYVYRDGIGNTHIDFYSDPNQFITNLAPTSVIVEDGTLQLGLTYMSDSNATQPSSPIYIFFTSDVPTPGAAALLGLGGLAMARRRR